MERSNPEHVRTGSEPRSSGVPVRRTNAPAAVANEFVEELSSAEEINLRERLGRLESSIAFWAADLDDLSSENERLREERDELMRRLKRIEDRAIVAEDARATLEVVLDDRQERIRLLELGLLEADRREVDAHSTRARLLDLRKRMRSRMTSQSREIEELRRMVKLGHAARLQIERELNLMQEDARRDARYLDRLEVKLRELDHPRD
ncbi:MAG: hypothetical protein AAF957_27575 [Planctomycetota bacterium]